MDATEKQTQRDSQWLYLAQWLDLSPQERSLRALPTTQADLATEFGLSDARVLRKWRDSPAFAAVERKAKRSNRLRSLPLVALDPVPVPEDPDQTPEPEAPDTDEVGDLAGDDRLEAIWRKNAESDPRAFKVWWDAFGKQKAEAAAAAAAVRYDQETLVDLTMEALLLLSPEVVVRWLAANNWRVERIDAEPIEA